MIRTPCYDTRREKSVKRQPRWLKRKHDDRTKKNEAVNNGGSRHSQQEKRERLQQEAKQSEEERRMRLEQKEIQELEAYEKWKAFLQSEDFSLSVLE